MRRAGLLLTCGSPLADGLVTGHGLPFNVADYRRARVPGVRVTRIHCPAEEDTRDMDRERAETHLRLLAEAELRRAMTMPAGSIPGRWYSARLALVAQALTAVGAVGANVAYEIQAGLGLAVAARHQLPARIPGPGRTQPAPRRTSWRVAP